MESEVLGHVLAGVNIEIEDCYDSNSQMEERKAPGGEKDSQRAAGHSSWLYISMDGFRANVFQVTHKYDSRRAQIRFASDHQAGDSGKKQSSAPAASTRSAAMYIVFVVCKSDLWPSRVQVLLLHNTEVDAEKELQGQLLKRALVGAYKPLAKIRFVPKLVFVLTRATAWSTSTWKVEPPDRKWQYLLFATKSYQDHRI
jgi:hypothetical protein